MCTHRIFLEEDSHPSREAQRRLNPKVWDAVKDEILKWLNAGIIYPISDSPWVSSVHVVPKKAWITDEVFSCVVKTQKLWSNKIYKTELTKKRYNNQVLCKNRVDPQRAGLTLIVELTWSNLGLKGVLNKRK